MHRKTGAPHAVIDLGLHLHAIVEDVLERMSQREDGAPLISPGGTCADQLGDFVDIDDVALTTDVACDPPV